MLEKPDVARHYGQLAERIEEVFNSRFFNGEDAYSNHGSVQTGSAMALALGLVPEGKEVAVLDTLVEELRERDYQQTTGDIGFAYLVETLRDHGHDDVLFKMTNRTSGGSYGFIASRGWTSMPEAWDASTHAYMNHCMLGHIQQWFSGGIIGISQMPGSIAYKELLIRPAAVGDLTEATGHYDTPYGRVAVSWRKADGAFHCRVTVPVNSTAVLELPWEQRGAAAVMESGLSVAEADGVEVISAEVPRVKLRLGSGDYDFSLSERSPGS